MNDIQQHKASDKIKWIATLIAFILIFITIGGYIAWDLMDRNVTSEEETEVSEEMVVKPQAGNGIRLMSAMLTSDEYEDYGVAALAESAYTITAKVKDDGGGYPESMQFVDWSMAWATTNSADVTDYVSMTTDGMTATFALKQGFSTQIIVTCTSTLDSSISATATIDYYRRLENVTVTLKGEDKPVKNGDVVDVMLAGSSESLTGSSWQAQDFNFFKALNFNNMGTISNNGNGSFTVSYTDEFKQVLEDNFGYDWTFGTVSYGGSFTKTYSQFEMLSELGSAGTYMGNYVYKLTQLFMQNSNEVIVTQTINCTHGGTQTVSFYLDLGAPATSVTEVNLDNTAMIF